MTSASNEHFIEQEKPARTARIDLRLTPSEKVLIAHAAAHEEMDLSAFARRTILAQAQKIVAQTEQIRLSKRDFERVLNLLENPPAPAPALLKAAAAKYSRR